MNPEPIYSGACVEIESLELINGVLTIIGTVEGMPLVYSVDGSSKDFEKFLPDLANVESVAKDFLYELYINTL